MTITIKGPNGGLRDIEQGDLQSAVDQGWTLATPAEVKAADFGGVAGKAAAFGGGLASGLTVGASDVALRAVLPSAADYVASAKEVNPKTGMLGEFTGVGIGLLYGAGEAEGASLAARAVGAPTRLVGAIGERAGAVAGERALLGSAIRAGTEGAIYGASTAVSEAALTEDYGHLGEKLMAGAAIGAVGGAGLSAVLEGAVPSVAKKFKSVLGGAEAEIPISAETRAVREATTAREKVGEFLERRVSSPLAEEEAVAVKKAEDIARGKVKAIDPDARGREFAAQHNELLDVGRDLRKNMFGEAKINQADALIDPNRWQEALEVTQRAYGEAAQIHELAKADINARVTTKKLGLHLEEFGKAIEGIEDVAADKRSLKLFEASEKFKRAVGDAAGFGGQRPMSGTAAALYDELYHGKGDLMGIRNALEHNSWGRMADAQKEINQIVSDRLSTVRQYSRDWTTKHGQEAGYALDVSDPGTYASMLSNINGAAHDLKWQSLENDLLGLKKQADIALKHYAFDDATIARYEGVGKKVDELLKGVQADKAEAKILSDIERMRLAERQTDITTDALRAVPGVGGILGLRNELMRKPIKRAEFLARIKGESSRIDDLVEKAVEGQLSGKIVPPPTKLVSERTQEQLDRMVKDYSEHAPKLGGEMAQAGERGRAFLESKRPRRKPSNSLKEVEHVSADDSAKYARYVHAVIDPISTLRQPLTKEHVEAMRAVYPKLYAQITSIAMQKAHEKRLTPSQRSSVSVLLDQPADWSNDPKFMAAIQQAYSKGQAAPQRTSKINIKSSASGADRLEAR